MLCNAPHRALGLMYASLDTHLRPFNARGALRTHIIIIIYSYCILV
jgi:hypothetical protein